MKVAFQNLAKLHSECENEINVAVASTIASGQFIFGKQLKHFEDEYSNYVGNVYCAGVNCGLDALQFALQALGIAKGDEVIVPAHTFIATWLSVLKVGATPIPIDCRIDTYNLDVTKIADAISPKTKAIIAVHLYGHPCDMDALESIANDNNLLLLEDAAQAHGASYKDRSIGSFGNAAAWSFYPAKNLGALGDAGAVTSTSQSLIERIRPIANYGFDEPYNAAQLGSNSRMCEIQASALRVKLNLLERWNSKRRNLAAIYGERLKEIDAIRCPVTVADSTPVWHQYVLATQQRDRLQGFLLDKGISTQIHYPIPAHQQKAVGNLALEFMDKELASTLSNEIISLPISPEHSKEEIHYICDQIEIFFR